MYYGFQEETNCSHNYICRRRTIVVHIEHVSLFWQLKTVGLCSVKNEIVSFWYVSNF